MSAKPKVCTYALTFSLDTKKMNKCYPSKSWWNGYEDIERVLMANGFVREGKLYVGKSIVTSADCIRAVLVLKEKLRWFTKSVRTIRMLRLEEATDLLPVLRAANM